MFPSYVSLPVGNQDDGLSQMSQNEVANMNQCVLPKYSDNSNFVLVKKQS